MNTAPTHESLLGELSGDEFEMLRCISEAVASNPKEAQAAGIRVAKRLTREHWIWLEQERFAAEERLWEEYDLSDEQRQQELDRRRPRLNYWDQNSPYYLLENEFYLRRQKILDNPTQPSRDVQWEFRVLVHAFTDPDADVESLGLGAVANWDSASGDGLDCRGNRFQYFRNRDRTFEALRRVIDPILLGARQDIRRSSAMAKAGDIARQASASSGSHGGLRGPDDLITQERAAEVAGCSNATIRRAFEDGRLTPHGQPRQVSRRQLIERLEQGALVLRNHRKSKPSTPGPTAAKKRT